MYEYLSSYSSKIQRLQGKSFLAFYAHSCFHFVNIADLIMFLNRFVKYVHWSFLEYLEGITFTIKFTKIPSFQISSD